MAASLGAAAPEGSRDPRLSQPSQDCSPWEGAVDCEKGATGDGHRGTSHPVHATHSLAEKAKPTNSRVGNLWYSRLNLLETPI
jgi:hypothetical protein